MKMKLANALMTFLAASLIATSARADDAAIKKQLVGYWKGPDNQTIVVKDDGVMISYDYPVPRRWEVRDGVFHTRFHDDRDSYKIISLTKTKFVIHMYHGRHIGTWTRIMASKARH